MRAVLQRVTQAHVIVDDEIVGKIEKGILILLGIENKDTHEDIDWLVRKIIGLRIFNNSEDKMNLSIEDVKGRFLVISQFTLYASTKKGNRPSFLHAARPEIAIPLYESFIDKLDTLYGQKSQVGIFGADMKVTLLNEGPVTIIIDTKNRE